MKRPPLLSRALFCFGLVRALLPAIGKCQDGKRTLLAIDGNKWKLGLI